MTSNFNNRQLPGNSPFANVLVVVLGAIAIAISFVIGFVAFVALAAAVLIIGAVVWVRISWLGLRSRKPGSKRAATGGAESADNSVIEGEYHVIPVKKGDDNSSQS